MRCRESGRFGEVNINWCQPIDPFTVTATATPLISPPAGALYRSSARPPGGVTLEKITSALVHSVQNAFDGMSFSVRVPVFVEPSVTGKSSTAHHVVSAAAEQLKSYGYGAVVVHSMEHLQPQPQPQPGCGVSGRFTYEAGYFGWSYRLLRAFGAPVWVTDYSEQLLCSILAQIRAANISASGGGSGSGRGGGRDKQWVVFLVIDQCQYIKREAFDLVNAFRDFICTTDRDPEQKDTITTRRRRSVIAFPVFAGRSALPQTDLPHDTIELLPSPAPPAKAHAKATPKIAQ